MTSNCDYVSECNGNTNEHLKVPAMILLNSSLDDDVFNQGFCLSSNDFSLTMSSPLLSPIWDSRNLPSSIFSDTMFTSASLNKGFVENIIHSLYVKPAGAVFLKRECRIKSAPEKFESISEQSQEPKNSSNDMRKDAIGPMLVCVPHESPLNTEVNTLAVPECIKLTSTPLRNMLINPAAASTPSVPTSDMDPKSVFNYC